MTQSVENTQTGAQAPKQLVEQEKPQTVDYSAPISLKVPNVKTHDVELRSIRMSDAAEFYARIDKIRDFLSSFMPWPQHVIYNFPKD